MSFEDKKKEEEEEEEKNGLNQALHPAIKGLQLAAKYHNQSWKTIA
ncbi:hypothetical protein [Klebsiella variicola]|nr:hypothetical protein [Klebsiella variicola]MDP1159989.1 hypothetical protein [Klebsiella variicola]